MTPEKRKPNPLQKLKPKAPSKAKNKDRSDMESTHDRTKRGKAISLAKGKK